MPDAPGFTREQAERYNTLRAALGVPPGAKASPEQMVGLIRAAHDDLLLVMVTTWDELGDAGQDCWVRNHEVQIEHYRNRAHAAENALRHLAREGATQAPRAAQDPRRG